MSTKNSKRSANDNISTIAKPAKRGCKKKENVDPLININYSQAKPNNVNKRGHKKKQETVASSSSQIIDELLNDTNNLQEDDEEVISIGELSHPSLTSSRQLSPVLESRIVSQLLSSPSRQQSPIRITSQITAPSRQLSPALESRVVSPRQLSPTLGLRTNAQNNFVSSNQLLINPILTSSRMPLTSDSNFSNNILGQFNPNRIAAPSPFNEMSIYQACLWLCANPNILQLANNMNLSTQTPAADGSQFMSPNSTTLTMAPNQDDKAKAGRDCLEELKCLFLRVRNPPRKAIENLIRQVIKCDLNSTEGIEWLQISKRHFGNFRNKLVNDIENLVKDFKKIRAHPISSPLQKEEIIAFVNEAKMLDVLNRWLNATNMDKLHAHNSINHLCKFVQSAFAVNYTSRDTEGTKALDRLTKSIAVPS